MSVISMNTFASSSDKARVALLLSFVVKNERNNPRNSSDPGSSDVRRSNPMGTLFEKPGSRKRQPMAMQ